MFGIQLLGFKSIFSFSFIPEPLKMLGNFINANFRMIIGAKGNMIVENLFSSIS